MRFSTKAIHSGHCPSDWPGNPVVCGISLSSTFKQDIPGEPLKYDYSRSGNPTRKTLEKSLASLEDANYGFAFASGLGAETTLLLSLSAGDHIICSDDVYGGTNRLFNKVFQKFELTFSMVDCTDPDAIQNALTDRTKLIWIETPTNPTLKIVDIRRVKKIIEDNNSGVLLVVDNTFMTPYFQNPLNLGADIVLHSITKYINGHSDVVMGCMMTNSETIAEKIKFLQNSIGAIPSPFDCYLTLRGIKTLSLRMERHQESAMKIAKYLESHDCVQKVLYPGLESHPQHELCKSQCSGFSGMITFYIKGNLSTAKCFLKSLSIASLAESLGGFETLIEHPALMTHASVPLALRNSLGISDTLIRLSVGLEDPEDLIDDFSKAFDKSKFVEKEES